MLFRGLPQLFESGWEILVFDQLLKFDKGFRDERGPESGSVVLQAIFRSRVAIHQQRQDLIDRRPEFGRVNRRRLGQASGRGRGGFLFKKIHLSVLA